MLSGPAKQTINRVIGRVSLSRNTADGYGVACVDAFGTRRDLVPAAEENPNSRYWLDGSTSSPAKEYAVLVSGEMTWRADPTPGGAELAQACNFDVRWAQGGVLSTGINKGRGPGMSLCRAGVPRLSAEAQVAGSHAGDTSTAYFVASDPSSSEKTSKLWREVPWAGAPCDYLENKQGPGEEAIDGRRWMKLHIPTPLPILDRDSLICRIAGSGHAFLDVYCLLYEADSPEVFADLLRLPTGRLARSVPGIDYAGRATGYRYAESLGPAE